MRMTVPRVDNTACAAGTTGRMFRTDAILPPDPEGLEVLHDREYRVRAYGWRTTGC